MTRSRVLVVCTANICRSPLAERLLAEFLVRRAGAADVQVTSAGTRARPGHPAAEGMQRIARQWGLDLGHHRSRRVDAELVTVQDLVITMEDVHRDAVSRLAAGVGPRTFTITELDGIIAADTGGGLHGADLPAHVAAWHAARARLTLDTSDVPDPYGRSQQDYERTAWQLAELVERLGPELARAAGPDVDDRRA